MISNFNWRYFVGCCVLEYLCEYLVCTVIYLVPNCGVGYFLDVVQIVGEVLRKYSNLIVGGYFLMIVLGIWRQDWWGNLREKCW